MTALYAAGCGQPLILYATLIVIVMGATTMAIGAYFTTKTEREHFAADLRSKTRKERAFLSDLDITQEVQDIASGEIIKENERWSQWMGESDNNKPVQRAVAIVIAYLTGGLIPLFTLVIAGERKSSFALCVLITLASLFTAGYIKSSINGINPWAGAFRIVAFTALAAGCVYGVTLLIKN